MLAMGSRNELPGLRIERELVPLVDAEVLELAISSGDSGDDDISDRVRHLVEVREFAKGTPFSLRDLLMGMGGLFLASTPEAFHVLYAAAEGMLTPGKEDGTEP